MTSVQVTLQGKCEVVRQIDVSVGDGIHRVADSLILVQLVFPDKMTVLILVAGNLNLALIIDVRSTVVLLIAKAVKDIITCIHVMQVNRIYRSDVTTVHEWVCITTAACTITRVKVLMSHI